MIKRLLSLFVVLSVVLPALAQVDCSNVGFEKGNTSGWELSYGTVTDNDAKTVYQNELLGTTTADHYITSLSDGNDRLIPSIPMVAPGSTHSIRIGNTVEGGHFSRIKTDYFITADNTLFQYKFAVVLQNTINGGANHAPYQKPGFNVQIYDSNGQELLCSSYDIQLQGLDAVDGFTTSGDLQYRDWTTGAIDLRAMIGKTITIVVTAHGCTRMRHLGYAYFDAECLKSEIRSASDCPDENGFMTLLAPQGFGKYTWSNGQTTQSIRVKARLGDEYSVKMVPLGSLNESCALQLDYKIPYKKTSGSVDKTICEGEQVAVGDTVYRTTGTFIRNINRSNVCDSTVTLRLKVNKVVKYTQNKSICEGESLTVGDTVYTTPGTHIRNVPQITGCDSIVTTHLTVVQLALSMTPDQFITQGDSVHILALTEPAGSFEYSWKTENSLSCQDCDDPWAKPRVSTQYAVSVTDPGHICKQDGQVKISVKPCGIEIPDAFTPGNDGHNELFYVFGNSCVKQIREMVIYSRWGEVIFRKENFAASDPAYGWPGTYQGVITASGAYPYKIKVELKSGELLDYKGAVHLIR
ncbi:T9SS type B sorting domain-containing protein [Dyadobacter psychrotolerans]|uniref:Gliding motility-associated C-terminal domain-containing protein n=1 Tax=Dyadobacter psychrotolerans TaxID=2541721 RepID=A0A4R5D9G8_9BACT|nr:gliding motility-associated C-terminal domain-containing protein [Dyadobacter psychrotolerans]TDE08391.1 gliding motility-associated C-terminal domain-containing protein [Dyadobacter psychrotolerans]